MENLDLSNVEGLDESFCNFTFGGFNTLDYLKYIAKYKAGEKFTDTEKYDILRIESNPIGKIRAASLRSQNGVSVPSLITPEPLTAVSVKNEPPVSPTPISVAATTVANSITPKKVMIAIPDKTRPLPKDEAIKEEKVKEETTNTDSTSKTAEEERKSGKFLGMPKSVAIGLGVLILAIGGFIAYKKFKK